MKFRKRIKSFEYSLDNKFDFIKKNIEEVNKKHMLNLIVINYKDLDFLDADFERYLLNLNKKILLIGNNTIKFKSNFYYRSEKINNNYLCYINNDVQYGSRYIIKRVLDIVISIVALTSSFSSYDTYIVINYHKI